MSDWAEVARLRDALIVRDMQLSTLKERLAQAEAKCDELRVRWDRAETTLENVQMQLERHRRKPS